MGEMLLEYIIALKDYLDFAKIMVTDYMDF